MAARRIQSPLRDLARSMRSVRSRSELPAASASCSSGPSSASRAFASAASSTASSSTTAAPVPSSRPSLRSADSRPSPALGTRITGADVLAHLSGVSSGLLDSNADLALRAVTHESYLNAREGHNRRLAFVGRRTLKLFTTLFLHSRLQSLAPGAARTYINHLLESASAVDAILSTHRLGDKVGRNLALESVMRWTPAVSDGQMGPRETGLFKVRGVAVEAIVGAIYHQNGAMAASSFFHSAVLPELLQDGFPAPVPQELKDGIVPDKS
ncbi:uncharacterized protein PAN0_038d6318 [Moesziomyces antarcticus]|uniref:Uncharacterized protein n=2 Tax=Pseudozyma antarctica TaxID=84753 RepID=A0A5C3FU38_PSEA2|nr:uncharacterized protein PAN0_038d6318 [Moesziomyces antarcticus]GAK68085.1 conserved hypothetical protein [Moesziomyces antarcticus]SPO47051.1 uncharacterized protein PSANT_04738 [Moesziomyces antarcticus]